MIKEIDFEYDASTWSSSVPREIAGASNPWPCDMFAALLSTALWTRPPQLTGFSLSDTWACLRYIPAISSAPKLRLRQEWSEIDAHQKTILSDDFGIGCATWWMQEMLGYYLFGETRYIVDKLPSGTCQLSRSARRGPSKAPDFLVFGPRGLGVLECKGSQSSIASLAKAMDARHGRAQKKAFKVLGVRPPADSLVIGTFVAQASSPEESTLRIVDPELRLSEIRDNPLAEKFVRIALMQGYLARIFLILDLPEYARFFADMKAKDILGMSGRTVFKGLNSDVSTQIERQHVWLPDASPHTRPTVATCHVMMPANLLHEIIKADNLGELLFEWSKGTDSKIIRHSMEHNITVLGLLLGVEMTLKIEER